MGVIAQNQSVSNALKQVNGSEKKFHKLNTSLPPELKPLLFSNTDWPMWKKSNETFNLNSDFYRRYIDDKPNVQLGYQFQYGNLPNIIITILNNSSSRLDDTQLMTAVKNDTTYGGQEIYKQWLNDKEIKVDNLSLDFKTPKMPANGAGLNLFNELYDTLSNNSSINNMKFTNDQNKAKFNYQDYANNNIGRVSNPIEKKLNNYIQGLYQKGYIDNQLFVLKIFDNFINQITLTVEQGAPGKIDQRQLYSFLRLIFTNVMNPNPDSNNFIRGEKYLYSTDPIWNYVMNAANNIFQLEVESVFPLEINQTNPTKTDYQTIVNNTNSAFDKFKIFGYLNIWQQWLLMWNNDTRADAGSLFGAINGYGQTTLQSYDYITSSSGTKTVYIGQIDWSKSKSIINLPVLYTVYFLLSLSLAGLMIYLISRKDFT